MMIAAFVIAAGVTLFFGRRHGGAFDEHGMKDTAANRELKRRMQVQHDINETKPR